MDIRIGVPMIAEDGAAGRVERIILHPATNEVVGVVAVQGGMLPHDVVVPSDRLLGTDARGLRVRGTVAEISELDPFAQSQYVDPPEDWLPPTDSAGGIYLFPATPYAVGAFERPVTQPAPAEREVEDLAPGDVDVTANTTVFCADGVGGRLERVVTEGASDHVTHLIVRRGALMGEGVRVPMDCVASLGDEGIRLTLTRDELGELPDIDD
jgi:hypothetical protein